MVSYIFEFTHDGRMIAVYKDDHGMYRVVRIVDGNGADDRETLLGVLREKEAATHVFNREVGRIVREWELS